MGIFKKRTLHIAQRNVHMDEVLSKYFLNHYLSLPYEKKERNIIVNYQTLEKKDAVNHNS